MVAAGLPVASDSEAAMGPPPAAVAAAAGHAALNAGAVRRWPGGNGGNGPAGGVLHSGGNGRAFDGCPAGALRVVLFDYE